MRIVQTFEDGWKLGINEDPEVVAGIPEEDERYQAESPSGKVFSGRKETIEKLVSGQSEAFKAWKERNK